MDGSESPPSARLKGQALGIHDSCGRVYTNPKLGVRMEVLA